MTDNQQIARIAKKLPLAKAKDKKREVFGAESHKYKIKNPLLSQQVEAFEQQYQLTLPDGYKAMITTLGNEGKSYPNYEIDKSFAGPNYGIFPLTRNNDVLVNDPQHYLSQPCTLTSMLNSQQDEISDELWDAKIDQLPEEDDAYEQAINELYAGILPIGSLGCAGIVGLILNGAHKGKVIYVNLDLYKPIFTHKYFLDWYECWLDEIIQDDKFLAKLLLELTSNEEAQILNALQSVAKFKKIKDTDALTTALIPLIHYNSHNNHKNADISKHALYLLTEHNYKKAKPFLLQMINSHDDAQALIACQSIHWYVKKPKRRQEWVAPLMARLTNTQSEKLLDFIFYILTNTKADISCLLHKLVNHENKNFRSTAYYNIGLLKDNSSFDGVLKNALQTEDKEVAINVLQSIGKLNNPSYIPYYKDILKRIPNDTYIVANVMNLLEELGIQSFDDEIQELLKNYFDSIKNDDECELYNIIIDFSRIPLPKLLEYATTHQDKNVSKQAKDALKQIKKYQK
ncbi:HEAT repeat domain-containing protein [Psychrobacter sp. I-STPA10]|uniref:HEAT repeat domain-containing protein n=1 Tax=Psychrobacter sp. I-STPA10 TaxID=2585769 RepID=UPI001E38788F|nr:HEAT repeat domain-containing protein [Psychrobacter sp. I-STPA10]